MQEQEEKNNSVLELKVEELEKILNPNVKKVALQAMDEKNRLEQDPAYFINGNYTESYAGETS